MERYSRKLEILSQGFQVLTDHPYKIPVTSSTDDMTLWPDVDYGNIMLIILILLANSLEESSDVIRVLMPLTITSVVGYRQCFISI
jgi:hypothetical protein